MNTIFSRLKEYIAHLRISNNEFGRTIGCSSAQITQMLTYEKNFGIDKLLKIFSEYPDLNTDWLLIGSGSMLRNNQDNSLLQTLEEPVTIIQESSSSGESTAYQNMYKAEREENKILNDKIAQMSIEIGMLKAQLNQIEQKESQGFEKGKRSPNVKVASLKKDLSKQIRSADSANAHSESPAKP